MKNKIATREHDQQVRESQITTAQELINELQFNSWPNREIENLAIGILDAVKHPHYSAQQNIELAGVLARLSSLLSKGLEKEMAQRRSDAAMRVYRFTQKLTLASDVDNPEKFQDEAAEAVEATRAAERKA